MRSLPLVVTALAFSFSTLAFATTQTSPATNITSSSVQLNGTVNTGGSPRRAAFFYWQTGSTVQQWLTAYVPMNTSTPTPYSAVVNGLPCGTSFTFQAYTTNLHDEYGDPMSFTTLPCAFVTTTNAATGTTQRSTTFNGTVQPPAAGSAEVWFRWRYTDEMPAGYSSTKETPHQIVSGASVPFSYTLVPTPCGFQIAYQAVALSGGTTVYGIEKFVTPPGCPLAEGDIDRDGETDLVLRDPLTGVNTVWYMVGSNRVSTGPMSSVPPEWKHIATTRVPDSAYPIYWPNHVWWNSSTGDLRYDTMDHATIVSSRTLWNASSAAWRGIAYDVFGNAGSYEWVWLKLATNQLLIGTRQFLPFTVSNSTFSGTADFDKNSVADLVYRDDDGSVRVHLLNSDLTRKRISKVGLLPSNFIVVGAADVNKDTWPDILIRNTTTGRVFVWTCFYNGTDVIATNSFYYTPDPPTNLDVISPR
ncbi:MAG TPA: VCBS repeat-containing protein [Thermoanaerobaculia bacterium]|nr:VCBS repeat-containing protein [Thermoanaerobaculia bacterium]